MKDIGSLILFFAIIILGVICYKIIVFFDVPIDVAIESTLFLIGSGVVGSSSLYLHLFIGHRSWAPFGYPLAGVLLVDVFFPILQYKAQILGMYSDIPFWGANWFYIIINIILLVLGYGILFLIRKD
ncbi:hypothetical protein E4T25_04255 [Photobacterium damselae subsp. piscicida]|uniref:hypothetical protein n=1 Tax=Photobacterium damselae TaxID=38293 RepID=UPI001076A477|nr:hypothetical protein [Photobacterium damselae]TFZ62415.1 hypothetical protein E4T25_04255 [Photobacterium damselae subsp. piscicida]